MPSPFATLSMPGPAPVLRLGQSVHVNARAAWLPATVTSISHTRIGVSITSGRARRIASVAPWCVRPARGIRLQPVHALLPDDEVVTFTGAVKTVGSLQAREDGWWLLEYADGDEAMVAPTAVLRLRGRRPSWTAGERSPVTCDR